jgi:hypothetical protein
MMIYETYHLTHRWWPRVFFQRLVSEELISMKDENRNIHTADCAELMCFFKKSIFPLSNRFASSSSGSFVHIEVLRISRYVFVGMELK